jgi:hypothetical protein
MRKQKDIVILQKLDRQVMVLACWLPCGNAGLRDTKLETPWWTIQRRDMAYVSFVLAYRGIAEAENHRRSYHLQHRRPRRYRSAKVKGMIKSG